MFERSLDRQTLEGWGGFIDQHRAVSKISCCKHRNWANVPTEPMLCSYDRKRGGEGGRGGELATPPLLSWEEQLSSFSSGSLAPALCRGPGLISYLLQRIFCVMNVGDGVSGALGYC